MTEKEVKNIVRIANINENEEEAKKKISKTEEKLEKRNRKLEDKYAALEQFNTMISQVGYYIYRNTFLRRMVWIGYIEINSI